MSFGPAGPSRIRPRFPKPCAEETRESNGGARKEHAGRGLAGLALTGAQNEGARADEDSRHAQSKLPSDTDPFLQSREHCEGCERGQGEEGDRRVDERQRVETESRPQAARDGKDGCKGGGDSTRVDQKGSDGKEDQKEKGGALGDEEQKV